MVNILSSGGFRLSGGKTGVLLIHGFTGSPASIAPWALGLNEAGFTVHVPALAGHATSWSALNATRWTDWYASAESALDELLRECDRVFVGGFSVGGALALRLSQIYGARIEGILLLNASIYDRRKFYILLPIIKHFIPSIRSGAMDVKKINQSSLRHSYERIPLKALDSLRRLWNQVEKDLQLVDLPLMVSYSIADHVVDPANSETIIDSVNSVDIREVIFENSFHNVALDYDAHSMIEESIHFIHDVMSGELARAADLDSRNLVDAEFDSLVSGLSLDTSSPSTYLDDLDAIDLEAFNPPNPVLSRSDKTGRSAITGIVGGAFYIPIISITNFDPFGLGPWPGIFAILGGIGVLIWHNARGNDFDGSDEGAII